MMRLYPIMVFTTLLFTLLCTGVRAQTTILLQSFEETVPINELPYSTNFPEVPDGPDDDVFGAVESITNIPTAADGTRFFGAIDVQSPATNEGDGILTFDAGTICNLTSAGFTWSYNAVGLDNGDDLYYTLVLDGFEETPVKYVDGGNDFTTPGWVEQSVSIPGTATTAMLKLTIDQNGSDQVGIDFVRLTATGTDGTCPTVCGVTVAPNSLTVTCAEFTDDDNTDALTAEIDYSGAESSVVVSIDNGATVGGDDPAVTVDGTISLTGLIEGQSYVVTISGGDCIGGDVITIPITITADFCTPSDLFINEVLPDPGSVNDANGDGNPDGSDDEFVELYNNSDDAINVSGFTLEENAGVFYTFPDGASIPGRGFYTVFAGGSIDRAVCAGVSDLANERTFIGLNNSGDMVILRAPGGNTVAMMSYGSEGNNDQSLALNPDGNFAGGYQQHSTFGAMVSNSACLGNNDLLLPVTLLGFTAASFAKEVRLDWQTTNEAANDRFELERSGGGGGWEIIGTVAAATVSRSVENNYKFIDERPLEGVSYYRLRQVDLTGASAIYGPIFVTFTGADFGIFPNPVKDEIIFTSTPENGSRITLLSANGRMIRELPAGNNRTEVNDLAPGIYLLRVESNNKVETLRFVKR